MRGMWENASSPPRVCLGGDTFGGSARSVQSRSTQSAVRAMKILVTGCCGFIGANFVRLVLRERPDWQIANLDLLTYAGNRENLRDLEDDPRYRFHQGDIGEASDVEAAADLLPGGPDAIVNFAAESHVDNSIKNPGVFVRTNVQGTLTLLSYAKSEGNPLRPGLHRRGLR